MRHILFIILLSSIAHTILAQDQLQSERLNQGATSQVLKKGIWQIESGFFYQGTSRGYFNQYYLQAPKLQQRYGLVKNVELRLAISGGNYFARNNGSYTANYYLSGFEAPVVGTKVHVLKQKKLIPQIAILAEATWHPLASSLFKSPRVKPNLQLLLSNNINEKLVVGYNIGSFWNDYFHYTYAFYIQKQWGKRLLTNIEYAGYATKPNEMRANTNRNFYGSIGYYISDRVLGDVGIGRGVQNDPDFFFKTGLSFVLKK